MRQNDNAPGTGDAGGECEKLGGGSRASHNRNRRPRQFPLLAGRFCVVAHDHGGAGEGRFMGVVTAFPKRPRRAVRVDLLTPPGAKFERWAVTIDNDDAHGFASTGWFDFRAPAVRAGLCLAIRQRMPMMINGEPYRHILLATLGLPACDEIAGDAGELEWIP